MTDFFCKTCNKYKPPSEKVMVNKPNGIKQAKCRGCVAKTLQPTPVTYIKPKHPDYLGLTLAQAAELKVKLKDKYGTATEFCNQHHYISIVTFTAVLRCDRKIAPKVMDMIKADLGVV